MADEKQLAILKQGVEAWSAWRDEHPQVRADLRGAVLDRANLDDARLAGAVLLGASLDRARLVGARLDGAFLDDARLDDARLDGAFLDDARLDHASLVGAVLDDASLVGTSLVGAVLDDARLDRARLVGARLVGARLDGARLDDASLDDASLDDARLVGARLVGARLVGASLDRASLDRAVLARARLVNASLVGASLVGASLDGASLDDANFVGARLDDARLDRAVLARTHLDGASLDRTVLYETIFVNVDLSGCKGLETCQHLAPSTVDIRTLQRSGPLPLAFLRGIGLPDRLIEYLPSLLNQPIQMYSCFISYSSKDEEFARRLHADLQDKGVRCWFAPEDMKIGDRIEDTIDTAIRLREKLLLVLSATSVTSAWVRKEVRTALAEERDGRAVLFPVRIDDAVMDTTEQWADDIRRTHHIGDFRHWKAHDSYQKALDRLLRDLRVEKA